MKTCLHFNNVNINQCEVSTLLRDRIIVCRLCHDLQTSRKTFLPHKYKFRNILQHSHTQRELQLDKRLTNMVGLYDQIA